MDPPRALVTTSTCDPTSDIDLLCGSFPLGALVSVLGRWEVAWNWKVGDVVVGKESSGGLRSH